MAFCTCVLCFESRADCFLLHKSLKLHRLGKKLHLQDKASCSFQSGIPLSPSVDTDAIYVIKWTSVFAHCKR